MKWEYIKKPDGYGHIWHMWVGENLPGDKHYEIVREITSGTTKNESKKKWYVLSFLRVGLRTEAVDNPAPVYPHYPAFESLAEAKGAAESHRCGEKIF